MDAHTAALMLAATAIVAVVLGLLAAGAALGWAGRLPGDLHRSNGNARVSLPITAMAVVSLALTILSYVFRRLL